LVDGVLGIELTGFQCAADALRELQGEAIQARLKAKHPAAFRSR